ncbi:hypothetical protein JTE90_000930 [Oedothorax gibbosus]|uniref:Centromere protein X n=1 Tax=Oedothorax gibbosus TaxID=931172 RepID=A0AAV6U4H6_9ARAC|nr:hypothetical protein JTE90_000930 [Oedothorax gibbosus]
MAETKNPDFLKVKCVEKLLKSKFKNSNTKISNDAVKLTSEVLKVFITECAARSAIQAKSEASEEIPLPPEVDNQHLEKILPQLLLDF